MVRVTVAHVRAGPSGEYVGRAMPARPASPLQNPHTVSKYGRDGAITRFRRDLWRAIKRGDHAIMAELRRLLALARRPGGVVITCWCKPEPCHGDVIAAALEYLDQVEQEQAVAAALALGGQVASVGRDP